MRLLLVFIMMLILLNIVKSESAPRNLKNEEEFGEEVYFNDTPKLFVKNTIDAKRKLKAEMKKRYKSPNIILRNIKRKNMSLGEFYTSSLTGENVPIESFTHNNMTPFFGGRLKQNMDFDVNDAKLENFTGVSKNTCNKDSERCFADVHNNVKNDTDTSYISQIDRIEKPKAKKNVLPIEAVKVGPGFNPKNKYASEPSGGYQQMDLVYGANMYKAVDDLRVKNNPKVSYEGVIIEGQKEIQRAESSDITKNRVETFYEKGEDDLFKTTGAYIKNSMKPCVDVKKTSRQDSTVEYKGPVHNSRGTTYNNAYDSTGPIRRKTHRENGLRNINVSIGNKSKDDYGRKNILVYENGRDVTSVKTREGNIGAVIKSLITPIQDLLKPTQKEYMTNNKRSFTGNVNGPNKLTIYDPNGVTRTTVKETTIHDTTSGNIRVNSTSIVYDPSEVAKTTLKEALTNYTNEANLKGANKPTVYDPEIKSRTTTREITENAKRDGNISVVQQNDGYRNSEYNAKAINKELLSDIDYYGMPEKENGDAYQSTEYNAKDTIKHELSDKEYTGNSKKEVVEPISYESIYNATIHDMKEDLLKDRVPTNSSTKISNGMDSVTFTKNKLDCDDKSYRDTLNFEKLTTIPPGKEILNFDQTNKEIESDRLDTTILSSLQSNPYVVNA